MKNSILLKMLVGAMATAVAGCGPMAANNGNGNRNTNSSTINTALNTAGNAVNTVANTVSNTAAAITTDSADDFLKAAAQGGMAEIELGKLAVTKAQNAEVKKYAQTLVADHAKASADLKALAAKKNVTLPTDMGSHKSHMDDLNKASGADFDKAYVEAMVEDHEADVAAFQKQADNATDADVKAFAAKTLPTLKKHLEQIKAIQAKMK